MTEQLIVKRLRPFLLRFRLPLTFGVTLLGGVIVILLAMLLGIGQGADHPVRLLVVSAAAAGAVLSLRLTLDAFYELLSGGQPGKHKPAAKSEASPRATGEQARQMDDLRRLNDQLATVNADLKQAKDQIERLDSVKTDFITIASHELRTPLAQMRGYTDIIDALNESGSLDSERLTGLTSNLRKAAERMEELIGAMLDTSQLDVNAMNLSYTPTTVETVVRMAIDPLADAIRERKITLRAAGLSGLPSLQGDMQRLVQAFRSVIVNAVKFTPDGGRIEIKGDLIQKEGEADCLHVSIRDTGVGISEENLELIFHKFYRAYDPSRHSTGAYKFMGAGPGLGLTIARGIIAGHGGRIWAESPGHDMSAFPGSCFHVLLPLTPPDDARRILPFGAEDDEAIQDTPPTAGGEPLPQAAGQ